MSYRPAERIRNANLPGLLIAKHAEKATPHRTLGLDERWEKPLNAIVAFAAVFLGLAMIVALFEAFGP